MIKLAIRQRLLCFGSCLSFLIVAALFVAPAGVAASSLDEALLAYEEEKALEHVLDARLALEKWYLERLVVLRNDGDASWLEVARQRTLVDTLLSQRAATQRLVSYFASLRERVELSLQERNTSELAESPHDWPAVKLALPGSLRLAGWLEWEQADAAVRAGYLEVLRATTVPPGDAQQQIDEASEKVADGNRRVSRLEQITGSHKATNDLARAKLTLALARAELELAHVTRDRQRSQSARLQRLAQHDGDDPQDVERGDATQPSELALLATAHANCITHDTEPTLRTATLRVAAQEARNEGGLRAAEINVSRLKRRVDDLRQLQAAGLATIRDVVAAEEEVEAAEALMQRLAAERSQLGDSYESLRQLAVEDDFPSEPFHTALAPADNSSAPTADQRGPNAWPMSCLTSAEIVRHIIDLKRKDSESAASCGALSAQLKMLAELESRLARAEQSLAARRGAVSPQSSPDDMAAALAKGRRRELENVRLAVELKSAQRKAAAERQAVIRLETDRFAHQMAQQMYHVNDESRVIANSTDVPRSPPPLDGNFASTASSATETGTIPVVSYDMGRVWRRRFSYIELHDTIPNVNVLVPPPSALGLVESATAFQPVRSQAFRQFGPFTFLPGEPAGTSTVYDRLYNRLRLRFYGLEPDDWSAFPADLQLQYRYGFARSPRRFASSLLSYFDEYDAFGSRRAKLDDPITRFDRRKPTTYLPGTPKRLPGTPRYLPGTPRRYE